MVVILNPKYPWEESLEGTVIASYTHESLGEFYEIKLKDGSIDFWEKACCTVKKEVNNDSLEYLNMIRRIEKSACARQELLFRR